MSSGKNSQIFTPNFEVFKVKVYQKLTSSIDFQRITSSSFRETDNFRLYRLLSRDNGRNQEIGPDHSLDTSFSYPLQKKHF